MKVNNSLLKIFLSIITIVFLGYVMPNIIAYLIIWSLGIIIPFIKDIIPNENTMLYLILKLLFIPIVIISNFFTGYISDLLFAFYFTILLTLMVYNNREIKTWTPLIILSKFSFSLYAIHYPILLFIIKIMGRYFNFDRLNYVNFENMIAYLTINTILIIFCYFFYLCFEKHTAFIRNYFLSIVANNQNSSTKTN